MPTIVVSNRCVNQPICQPMCQPLCQATIVSAIVLTIVNHFQPLFQPFFQPLYQPLSQSTIVPIDHCLNQPLCQPLWGKGPQKNRCYIPLLQHVLPQSIHHTIIELFTSKDASYDRWDTTVAFFFCTFWVTNGGLLNRGTLLRTNWCMIPEKRPST